jgi:insertion element IS1 protein InsB
MSDYWRPDKQLVPKELHTQSKGYSKSKIMLKYSVMLLMRKWNGELDAILLTMPSL